METSFKDNRKKAKALLEKAIELINSKELLPIAVWTERTYAQDDASTGFYAKKEIGELEENAASALEFFVRCKGKSIYFNHIAYELMLPEIGKAFIGFNDFTVSLSKRCFSYSGERVEL